MAQRDWSTVGLKAAAVLLALVAAAAAASAEVASALLVEGQPLPDLPGVTVTGISNPAVSHAGGYSVLINCSDSLARIWGDPAGGAGAMMITEGTTGDYLQTSFESFFGMADGGQLAYSAIADHIPAPPTGLDGVWVDSTPVLVADMPFPAIPGMYSSFNSRAGMTAAGSPYWIGGYTEVQGGTTLDRALLYGVACDVLLKGGDAVAGVAEPVEVGGSNISFDTRLSPSGAHYITEVIVASSTATDTVMVVDDAAILAGGALVREGTAVPAGVGGLAGELWANFDFLGILDGGGYLVTGDTSAVTTQDEFVLVNGQIVYREGDTIDGQVVSGDIEGAYLNGDGDVAFIWDVAGNTIEALFVGGHLAVKEGDLVDLDGDGTPEPDSVLAAFTGISSLTLGDRAGDGSVAAYFVGDVTTPGGPVSAALKVTVTLVPPAVPATGVGGLAALLAGLGWLLARRRPGHL